MDGLRSLNALPGPRAQAELLKCCGSTRWAEEMVRNRPFKSPEELFQAARGVWEGLGRSDWLEAFAAHPRIGDKKSLRAQPAATAGWAASEQAGTEATTEAVLEALAEGNRLYEERFSYVFIVCATGKIASEMLEILRSRLPNDPEAELSIAAGEQAKITRLRLEKLMKEAAPK